MTNTLHCFGSMHQHAFMEGDLHEKYFLNVFSSVSCFLFLCFSFRVSLHITQYHTRTHISRVTLALVFVPEVKLVILTRLIM